MDFPVNDKGVYAFGPFRLDPLRRTLTRNGEPVKLPARPLDTLVYLIEHQGRLVEKDELLAAIWPGRVVEEGNLTQTIHALRKVLQQDGVGEEFIVTTAGRGYRFAAPVRLESGAPAVPPLASPAPPQPAPAAPAPASRPPPRWRRRAAFIVAALVLSAVPAFVALRALRPPAATPSVPDFAPPPHSVAVLAFDNLSGDPSQEYFSDGLAEELITTLGRIDKILVAARVSAFSFKHTTATVADIAHALNVGAVLEGSVRRDGTSLRINVELIDARTGFQIWSRSFDRGLGDRLQVQADIATAVAGALQVSMLGADPKKLTSGGTENPAAFDAYLRGMTLMRTGVVADYKAALAEFDTAVKLDPGFVRGHAGRAYALVDIAVTTVSNDPAIMKKAFADARAAAEHAVALGPDVAQGHGALSTVLDLGFLDPVGADAEAARAVALEPANAAILSNFAEVELDVGHTEQGIAAARRTTALDPLRPDVWRALAFVLFEARRYAEATDALNRVRPLTAKLPSTWYDLLARIELAQGNATAALTDCARGTEGEREKCAAMANHVLGNTEAATAALAKLRALVGDTGAFDYAEIFAQWGDVPQALHWLETALALRDPQISQLKADPSLDPIRDDPRFKAVEAALHFPP